MTATGDQLNALVLSSHADVALWLAIDYELSFRRTKGANAIRDLVQARLANFGQSPLINKISSTQKKAHKKSKSKFVAGWPVISGCPAATVGYSGSHYDYQQGLLSYVGYRVGATGLPQELRRKLLQAVLANPLPHVGSTDRMVAWGQCSSERRKAHLIKEIDLLIRLHGGTPEKIAACADWRADLQWTRGL